MADRNFRREQHGKDQQEERGWYRSEGDQDDQKTEDNLDADHGSRQREAEREHGGQHRNDDGILRFHH